MYQLVPELAARHYDEQWIKIAQWYRSLSMDAIKDQDIVLQHLDNPLIAIKNEAEFSCDCVERTRLYEALSYGDASFQMTIPGPSLSGVLIAELGNAEQKEYFYRYIMENVSRSFFAVTEPGKGSDADNMMTSLDKKTGLINGEKMLFGNGGLAPIGTMLLRTGKGPLGMRAVMLTPEMLASESVERATLDLYAIRGSQIGYLKFTDCKIDEQFILGEHLPVLERGMMSLLKTFHKFRPGVAGMAIGTAQAAVDYLSHNFANSQRLQNLAKQLNVLVANARELNLNIAKGVDADPLKGASVSLGKMNATRVAEQVVQQIADALPAGALLEHPWLHKAMSDVYGFEFMEGTYNIQLNNVYNGYKRKELQL